MAVASIPNVESYCCDTKRVFELGYSLSIGTGDGTQLKSGYDMNSTAAYAPSPPTQGSTQPSRLSVIISFVAYVPANQARNVMITAGKITKSSFVANLEAAQTNLAAAGDLVEPEKVIVPSRKQIGGVTPPVIYVPPPPTPVPTPAPTRPKVYNSYVEGPLFIRQVNTSNPINAKDVGVRANPVFVDIDGDGDDDLFVGNEQGVITFFENTGTRQNAMFTERTGVANFFNNADVGSAAAPAFVDIDSDRDFDAFIGNANGKVLYFQNVGNKTHASFSQVSEASRNPLHGVAAPGHPSYRTAKPTFVVTGPESPELDVELFMTYLCPASCPDSA